MEYDRLGRLRQPDQARGLRPLHPLLPTSWESRSIRVAMSAEDWARFEATVAEYGHDSPTQARAFGTTIAQLLHNDGPHQPRPLDWLDWERQKTLRLLRFAV